MPLRLSKAQARAYGFKPKPKRPTARPYAPYKSQWEYDYAQYLTADARVKTWLYEGITLRLAPKTTYTPDFMTTDARGKVTFFEVKGFARQAGMIKLKVAARMFPHFTFILVRKVNGLWEHTEIPHH